MRLVIVESPAKAKTINKYLGSDFKVMASYGHIRDLLAKDGSVQPDNDFSMVWEMSARGKKCVQDIVKQLKNCDELLLATDPDREGEAISWHIKEVLQEAKKLKVPFKRIAFHEITKGAIKAAIENPRDIDNSLVDAYLARRALDYLVGFNLSPILWRKLPGSKSAGRVQSVALRIIVDRETEIESFEKKEYWTIEGKFAAPDKKVFPAHLTHHKGKKLDKFSIKNEQEAQAIKDELVNDFSVTKVDSKIVKRNPAPAFITSTLQQEASRKLGFSAKKTMQLAQNLYEGVDIGGETKALITYMRTDSINLSTDAVNKIRQVIEEKYGKDFVPSKPRVYNTKVKNAQEAHEAIRPVDAGIIPDTLEGKLSNDQLKLYTLIWKRAVACQMSSAEFNKVQVDLSDQNKNIFRANGNTVVFEGFLKVYVEGRDDQDENEEGLLPPLKEGDNTPTKKIEALQHFTTPPPRFSEASLVKKLEELGIGRPSTYATILQVLQDRGYVKLMKKFFVPEIRGRLVTSFLMSFFSHYLEYGFTADLEQFLDDISNNSRSKLDVLNGFWKDFSAAIAGMKNVKISDVIDKLNESMEKFLFMSDGKVSRQCPECKEGELSLKIGRFGSFIGCSRYPECKYVRKLDSSPMNQDDNVMIAASEFPKFLGNDPTDNAEILLKKGPYGLYLEKKDQNKTEEKGKKKEKPLRAPVPKTVEANNIDLNMALFLLSLPKSIGTIGTEEVKVGIGRYGPYVFFKGKYVSIPKTEDIFSMDLPKATEILKKSGKVSL
ncbi:MAG: type I DNA topoisomerase [Alphaproteobacteria bacterium]|nr:type I DNA topoisomerase [Alphaproteobacteria bacterium]